MKPILKWAGGNSRLMPRLRPFLPAADCLVEPFVAGASVFLNTEYRRGMCWRTLTTTSSISTR